MELGAQGCYFEQKGAFTGATSTSMVTPLLKSFTGLVQRFSHTNAPVRAGGSGNEVIRAGGSASQVSLKCQVVTSKAQLVNLPNSQLMLIN